MELIDWSRYLIAGYFFLVGIQHLKSREVIVDVMQLKHIPFAKFLFYYGVFYEIVLSMCLFMNFYTSLSATFLIFFDLFAILTFHAFWKMSGELRRLNQMIFITNATVVIGALLSLINLHDLLDLWREGCSWVRCS